MCLNLKLVQIGWKAPPPFCLLVRYSACVVAHDVTSCIDISCIIEPHIGCALAETPPPMREIFWHQIYPFQLILSNFGFGGRKAPPPDEGNFYFLPQIYPFQAILSNFGFGGRNPPNEGNFFDLRSIHFRQFWVTLVLVAEKPPPPPHDEGNFFDLRSIHFRHFWATLVLVAEKPPPPMREIFWHQIYPFQAILSNFGFGGRKAPFPRRGKFFWPQIYPFQAILSNFGFGGRKVPPMREIILTPDLSISGNFEQLCFWWQKSPPSPRWGKFLFFTSDLSISGHFEQLWFWWQKPPPMREIFLTSDLSISGNFE